MNANLYAVLARNFPIDQARPYLRAPDGAIVSYRYLEEGSARIANLLVERGVAPGDRIAVQVEKSATAVLLWLACARCGAVFLPLNTAYTAVEVEYFVNDAEPRLLIGRSGHEAVFAPLARAVGAGLLTLDSAGRGDLADAAVSQSTSFATVERTAGDLAAILYTSGTTGRSKGAMLTHANLTSNALVLRDYWRFTADDVLLHALPIYHTHGLFVGLNVTLMAGASILFLPRFDADDVFRLLPQASVMMGVPTFYTRLLADARLTPGSVRHMRLFVSGSAPLLEETHRAFEERTGLRILERYGMTEIGMHTSNPYDGERRAGTVGLPLPGGEVRVAEPETGQILGPGEIGVLEVRGPNVFRGYWRMPDKTTEEFRSDGWFITGDLGRIDERGYVHIVGRAKDLVISGGFNVYPKEVESELDRLPGVVESAVIGVPHPDFGEGVTAVVVPRAGQSLDERALLAPLAERLAKYKLPKRVLFVDELPRNTMGKVQKNQLRERYRDLYAP